MIRKALEIAAKAHEGQVDKAGAPYILHPLRVMFSLSTEPERIGGVLHDVLEDSPVSLEELQQEGFTPEVLKALSLVTKEHSKENYQAFIDRVLTDPLAMRIKTADLLDNLDRSRLKVITEKDLARFEKYEGALKRVKQASMDQEVIAFSNPDPKKSQSLFLKALEVSVKTHEGQYRKGTHIPYIVHPVEVALILMEEGCQEEVVAAGLLHDVLEDGGITVGFLQDTFGDQVAKWVLGASEELENRESRPWEERKEHTIHHLEGASKEEQMIACADKLSNVRSMVQGYQVFGDQLWDRFNRGYEQQKWYYIQLADSFGLIRRNNSYQEFASLVKDLFRR